MVRCSAVYLPSGVVRWQTVVPVLALGDGDRNGCDRCELHPHDEAVVPLGMNE